MRGKAARAIALVLAILLLMAGERVIRLPDPQAAGADDFSAARAKARLARVLGPEVPHPVDSAANDGVRARIVAELRALGLAPVTDDGWSCNGTPNAGLSCARVRNIRATVGPGAGRHLLVAAHYDSTAAGPGAADDGIGVASMLEVAALLARDPPARPVTFLFNEGEEVGLLGARAFLDRDLLADRVDALVNLEARGVEGPAIMFETSRPNGAAVGWLTRATSGAVTNSLATDFYRLIPNSTDVRVLGERPWMILNFAVIGNETRYHSPGDTVARLDARSLQHMGDQLLQLTRTPVPPGGGERVFTDLWGRALVTVPGILGFVGLALAGMLLLLAAWRRRAWAGALANLLAILGAGALSWGALRLIGAFRLGEFWRAQPDAMSLALLLTAIVAATVALRLLGRDRERARAGAWALFLGVGAAATAVAPGASIFFLLPALLAGLGLVLGGRAERWLLPLAAASLVLSWAPLVGLLEILLDFDAGWIFAGLYALILVPVLIELGRMLPTGLAAAAASASWVLVAALPAYSADRNQAFGLEYVQDGGRASWAVVNDGAPLPPRVAALAPFAPPRSFFWSARPRWSAPAPAGLAPTPALELIGSEPLPGGRRVRVRLRPAGAEGISLHAPAGRVSAITGPTSRTTLTPPSSGGSPLPGIFRCQGRSCDGLEVTLDVRGSAPLPLALVAIRPGLPAGGAPLLAARPAHAAPQYAPDAAVGIARLTI